MMKNNFLAISLLSIIIAILAIIPIVSAQTTEKDTSVCSVLPDGYSYIFFYSETCAHCKNVERSGKLESLEKEFNITINRTLATDNKELFMKLCSHVDDSKFVCLAVPTLFVMRNNQSSHEDFKVLALQGDKPIIEMSSAAIKSFQSDSSNESAAVCETGSIWKSLIVIILAGLSDSINPCIMSVLAVLLIQISVISIRSRILKLGSIFILTVFLSYMIIGLLILFISEIFITNLGNTLASSIGLFLLWLIVIVLIIAGLINIKDYFWYGKGISFRIPQKYLATVNTLVKTLSLPSILLLAVLITIIEFPCSGIMYVGVVGYLRSQFQSTFTIIMLLILYNIIFVLPLIVMVLLTYFGTKPEHFNKMRMEYRAWFRLIMGLGLVALAIFLVYSQGLL